MVPTFPALVTTLALLVYAGIFMTTARARARHGIQPPAVTGAPEFERLFRIQQNTLEQLIWFLPSLWLLAFYVSPTWGGLLGLVADASVKRRCCSVRDATAGRNSDTRPLPPDLEIVQGVR